MFHKWFLKTLMIGIILMLVACQGAISFTVSFHSNGGSNVSPITYVEGEAFNLPGDPTRSGYTFDGWYFDQDLFEQPLTSTSWIDLEITSDVTLYAKWNIQTYTITYMLDGGTNASSNPVSFTVLDEQTFEAPTKVGYMFDGWYSDQALTTSKPSLVVGTTGNLILYAKWTRLEYMVTWKNHDGTILEVDLVYHNETPIYDGATPTRPSTETEKYTFNGWTPSVSPITNDIIYTATFNVQPLNLKDPFDPSELNDVFGFNIYNLMPSFVTSDVILLDYSEVGFYEVYIDIFDWSEADADAYIALLDASYPWDDYEESWVLGNYFIYIYADDQTYPGKTVYGIGIYGEASSEEDPQTPFDYTELNDLFGFDLYHLLPTITSDDAIILDYSEPNFREVYVDFFDWTEADADAYIALLDKALTWDDAEESWIVGDYFIYVYADDQSYPGKTVYGIGIYGAISNEPVVYPSWADMMIDLKKFMNDSSIGSVLPELEGLSSIQIQQLPIAIYKIEGAFAHADYVQRIEDYIVELEGLGYAYDRDWSLELGEQLFTYELSENLGYAIFLNANGSQASITFWSYDPTIEKIELNPLSLRQSINAFELQTFQQSGLPSTGTFDVLVIPVEISGTPFPSDYQTKLDLVFNGSSLSTGWESVSSFYQKSSYGLLDLNFVISQKYTTQNTKTYYENYEDEGDQYAIKEALLALNPSINFANYDTNNDGLIDAVIFIYSENYNYDVNPWWAWVYAAQFGEAANTILDGKVFEYYMWASYYFLDDDLPGSNPAVNAETYIHELGHLMGLIDYYSFTYDYGPLGGFDMMDYNAGDHGPASKLLLGWLQPMVAIPGTYQVSLESYANDTDGLGSAIIIPYRSTDFDDGNAFDEFIIIMFYTPEGLYDAHEAADYVPNDAGIVIYHVDARLYPGAGFWEGYFMYNNDGDSDFFVEVLEVDQNNSMPGSQSFYFLDMLRNSSVSLNNYQWHQGGSMNISIVLNDVVLPTDDQVTFTLYIN